MLGDPKPMEWLLDQIEPQSGALQIVGIDGGGGAGKTTLARRLQKTSSRVQCVHVDDFYRPSPDDPKLRAEPCWFFDWRRIRDEVLVPLKRGEAAQFRPYDWHAERLSDDEISVEPRGIVILEGISALRRELRPWIDVGLWVETPPDIRLERGVERDGEDARDTWVDFWMTEEERYFDAHQPHLFAQVSIYGDAPRDAGQEVPTVRILERLDP